MLSVLIIDDEEEVLGVIRLFLERFGDMTVQYHRVRQGIAGTLK